MALEAGEADHDVGCELLLDLDELAAVRAESGEEAAAAEQERLTAAYTETVINPDKAVAIGEIDAVIAPEDTRNVIVDSLAALRAKNDARPESPKKHDNIPL